MVHRISVASVMVSMIFAVIMLSTTYVPFIHTSTKYGLYELHVQFHTCVEIQSICIISTAYKIYLIKKITHNFRCFAETFTE